MIYRSLGSTDLQVSHIGLGTVQLGTTYGFNSPPPPSVSDAIGLIHTALDCGINYIDTASTYGQSEEVVGKACSSSAGSSAVICTKVTLPNSVKQNNIDLIKHLEVQLDRSRHLLRRDELELVKLHSQLKAFVNPTLLDAMEHFKTLGWVRHWGVTTYGLEAPLDAVQFPEHFAALQVAYNALDRRLENDLFPLAKKQNMGLVIRSVFLQGILADRFVELPEHLTPLRVAADNLRSLARESGQSLASLAFRFAVFHSDINTAIFGTTSEKELRDNMEFYLQGPLDDDLIAAIRRVELSAPDLLNPANWRLGA